MNERPNDSGAEQRRFRYQMPFYKPNMKGTGGALKLELHPAHDTTDGSIWARLANQMTIGNRSAPTPVYPRFDWDNALCVKLDFTDLSKMLQVLRGECDAIEDGKGLVHTSPRGRTHINLRRVKTETDTFLSFEVRRYSGDGEQSGQGRVTFTAYEARGLTAAIEGVLGVICFGIPLVIERDVTAYKQATREMRHAQAVSA